MRGFAALLVAAAFGAVAFHSLLLERSSWQAGSEELEGALKASALRSVEDDLAESFEMVLRKAGSGETNAQKRAEKLVFKLAEWERFEEGKYAPQAILVDAWFGAISQEEKNALAVKMLEEKRVLKCAACRDFSVFSHGGNEKKGSGAEARALVEIIVAGGIEGGVGVGWSAYLKNEGLASVSLAQAGGGGEK